MSNNSDVNIAQRIWQKMAPLQAQLFPLIIAWLYGVILVANAWAADKPREKLAGVSLLQQALAGPMQAVKEIVFCTRLKYDDPHWYANIGYFCEDARQKAYPGNGQPDVSKLYKLDVRNGELSVLLDAQGGTVRDPQVHYDSQKILFSYRQAGSDYFHLYEIQGDGAGLRQLTFGEFDDYEPTYLPDGGIAFVSTRCKRWVNCWKTQVGVLYRCDADGKNIQLISANTEHDNTPWVLPYGRLLYTRWEYVDRSQVEFHHLWTMNPDGTGQTIYFGNMHPHIVMIDAKPIPGTRKVVASFSPGHGANEHAGIATIVSADRGPDDLSAPQPLHKGRLTRDPYAFSEDCVLAARDNQLVLMNNSGQTEVIYTHQGLGGVHEPRPMVSRALEPIIPQRADQKEAVGRMILTDVYLGRNLTGVQRGQIKKLLVLESLPKPVNFSGGPDLVSWLGTFTLERVLGTVPVEPDGSAYFEVPAYRQVFFVALDEEDMSVKRMQSFTCVMPGEVISCAGCHEARARAPQYKVEPRAIQTTHEPGQLSAPVAGGTSVAGTLLALRHPPSQIESFAGFPDVLDFPRDIQPILDRHCVKCHNPQQRDGAVSLVGDLGPNWSHSYFSLFAHQQVADGRNGLGNQPPRTIGSSASALLNKVQGRHYQVKVSPREWRTLWLWIESGAPYAGTYAALRNESGQEKAARASLGVFGAGQELLRRRCGTCHEIGPLARTNRKPLPFNDELRRTERSQAARPTAVYERLVFENDPIARFNVNILLNFTRPELSPLILGPLAKAAGGYESCAAVFANKSDPDYQQLLAAIKQGKALLDIEPRFSTAGFKPNQQYVRELKKFGILPGSFDLAQHEIDVYQTDQDYWESLWLKPAASTTR
jgi:hypothetical protein